MKITSLKIHNILSIEDAEIKFEDSGLILVEGWNFDDGRANGAGKTAIFNALSYGLYGDVPRKINISDIVRKDCKHGYAEVEIRTVDCLLKVKRERPNKVTYYRDNQILEIGQKEFEALIKLSYEQFIASLYNPQSSNNRFILLNDSGKKDFLLKLMSLDAFSSCKKEVDLMVKTITKDIGTKQQLITSLESKREVYRESIKNVDALSADVQKYSEALVNINKVIVALQATKKPTVSFDKENEISDKLNRLSEIKAKRTTLMSDYNKLISQDISFAGDETCNQCGSSIDLEAAKVQHEQHRISVQTLLKETKAKIDKLDLVIDKESQLRNELKSVREERFSLTTEYDEAVSKISELRVKSNSVVSALNRTKEDITGQANLQNKISVIEQDLTKCSEELKTLVQKSSVYETLSMIYSSGGAPAYVLDFVVESFNESIADYVSMIWPNARYVIKTYKENAKGDLTTKFSEELIIAGKERSIGGLSGAKFRCLSLAIDFAVIDVLSKNFSIPLNPIIMDEPFEGLDSAGREVVVELLEKLAVDKCIIIVDHASEVKAMFSKVIKVEKRNGISRIA